MTRAAAALLAAVALLPACTDGPTASVASTRIVLQVSSRGGGSVPGSYASLPAWTLYDDGRVIWEARRAPSTGVGPLLDDLRSATVSAEDVRRIADGAREAGVDGVARDYGELPVWDAGTTVFVLHTDRGRVANAVYALEMAPETGTPENDARRTLHELFRHLLDLDGWLGEGTLRDEEPYEPEAFALYARRMEGEYERRYRTPWRGPAFAAGEDTPAGLCTVLTGETLEKVWPDITKANVLTVWVTDDGDWSFRPRQLLPGESTCADGTAVAEVTAPAP
ncbi:MAG TPA: hypothetical protein VNQ77_00110 [Frankiaceae bacterium]|nr:hypothetical protein [Frankiaceae bacterium]